MAWRYFFWRSHCFYPGRPGHRAYADGIQEVLWNKNDVVPADHADGLYFHHCIIGRFEFFRITLDAKISRGANDRHD